MDTLWTFTTWPGMSRCHNLSPKKPINDGFVVALTATTEENAWITLDNFIFSNNNDEDGIRTSNGKTLSSDNFMLLDPKAVAAMITSIDYI